MKWHLKGEPYAVQKKALELSEGKLGFCFLKEMGTGKSADALNEYIEYRELGLIEHLIITCPNSLKRNWRDEIEKWGVDVEVVIWPSKPKFIWKDKKQTQQVSKPICWVFNYEAMMFSGGEELHNFMRENKCMWTLDESSRIKNFNAKTTKSIISMSPVAHVKRILTGTPMSQSVMDLWAQLRFIGELVGVNPYAFRNHYAIMGGYMGKQVVGAKNEVELQKLLSTCAFQAKKKDWTDLPDKIYTTRHVDMIKPQQDAYNDMKRDFLLMMKDSTVITAQMVITQLNKLQQISRGFIYDDERDAQTLVEPEKNPCIDVIKEVLDEIDGKIVVMAQYRHSMSVLYKALYAYDPARITGGMTDDELAEEKRKFNETETCRVIVTQIGVGGIGHTLLGTNAHRCSTMIFYENTFSLEKRKQAEDRIHRYGQDKACLYIDIATSAVDRKLSQALQRKDDLVKSVMDGVKKHEF